MGRRVYPNAEGVLRLAVGEYGIDPRDGRWYARAPSGDLGCLVAHDVTEHDDGTITVSPSILITQRRDGRDVELWHGYLERGMWRTC